jgi:isopentenyl-diphosphate delta-isomerase
VRSHRGDRTRPPGGAAGSGQIGASTGGSTHEEARMPDQQAGGDQVVLCSPDGRAVGVLAKRQVHHRDTPLHLAFSCYVVDTDGRLLLTRRAWTKATWPGVRTNSCCGHPGPGEAPDAAVIRRLGQELGLRVDRVDLVLPEFAYRAVMADGTVENELCPVYRATVAPGTALRPDPAEVAEAWWLPWQVVVQRVADDPGAVSPWCALQVRELGRLGALPADWPPGSPERLPAAARDHTGDRPQPAAFADPRDPARP